MAIKFGLIFCSIFLTIYADFRQPVKNHYTNGCALKYRKDVPYKPDIFLTTVIIPGICRIQKHQHESTENYETMKVEYYRKESDHDYGNWDRGPVIPSTIQSYNISNYQGLNFDVRTKSLLYIDRVHKSYNDVIVRRRFNDSQLIAKFSLRDRYQNLGLRSGEIFDLAHDWRTKNIYFVTDKGIDVMNLNKPWQPINVVPGVSPILNIAVHPNAGYLFYVEMSPTDMNYNPTNTKYGPPEPYKGEYQTAIYRTHLDGSNRHQIGPVITHRDAFIDSLVIDYHTDRLYWNVPHRNIVQSSNLDGTDVKNVIDRTLHFGLTEDSARSISFDQDYTYYLLKNGTVRRMHKQTGGEEDDFEIYNEGEGLIYSLLVYDPQTHKITTDHPCLVDNGGCEQYCFARPKDANGVPSRTCRNSNA